MLTNTPSLAEELTSKIGIAHRISTIGVNPNTDKIFVGTGCNGSSFTVGQISVVDGLTNIILDEINLPEEYSFEVTEIKTNTKNNKLYIVNQTGILGSSTSGGNFQISYDVNIFDSNNQPIKNINAKGKEVNLAINPNTNLVYISNYPDSGSVGVIDDITNEISNNFNPEIGTVISDIALNQLTNKVYVADSDGNIAVIDGKTNTKVSTINLNAPSPHLIVNHKTNKVYASSQSIDKIYVINGNDNSIVDEIKIVQPIKMAINTETNRLYTYDDAIGAVSVTDLNINKVVAVVILGKFLNGIAVNQNTNKIYVSNGSFKKVFVIDGSITTSTSIRKQVLSAINEMKRFQKQLLDRKLDKFLDSLKKSLFAKSSKDCNKIAHKDIEKLKHSLPNDSASSDCVLPEDFDRNAFHIKEPFSIVESSFSIDENKNNIADICEK